MNRNDRHNNVRPFPRQSRPKAFGTKATALLFGAAIALGGGIGAGMHYWPSHMVADTVVQRSVLSGSFTLCTMGSNPNCVIDGDTIWMNGDKVRLVGLNTPEISNPACEAEAALGQQATERLLQLLNSGELAFTATPDRNRDRYGRLLREVRVNGKNVADVMISEGLAEPYQGGAKRDWC